MSDPPSIQRCRISQMEEPVNISITLKERRMDYMRQEHMVESFLHEQKCAVKFVDPLRPIIIRERCVLVIVPPRNVVPIRNSILVLVDNYHACGSVVRKRIEAERTTYW
ncbi:hypothetical protein J6590_097151 [Homalodisca vitripennis]|nr:hypothetical protein J6590_097151 [Homalodisca vitripennis]